MPWIARPFVALLLALLLLAPLAPPAAASAYSSTRHVKADVSAWADELLPQMLRERGIPGAVLVVVQGDSIVYSRGYGYADAEAGIPMDPERITLRVGSITKTFTALAAMQLVEQGKLALDADVNRYLDGWQLPATYPEPVRLRDLLTHTAGFEERRLGSSGTGTVAPPLAAWLRHPPARVRPPGTLISYSNYGYALAGHLIERASGEPYATYVQRHILAPLAMHDSSAEQPIPAGLAARLSQGYVVGPDGQYTVAPTAIADGPAGSLVSTGADMGRYLIAQLNGFSVPGGRLLLPETARELHAQQAINHPALPGWSYGFYERSENGRRLLAHGGDLPGFSSLALLLPAERSGLFVLFNQQADPLSGREDVREELLRSFMDRFYPTSAAPEPAASGLRASPKLAGAYRYSRFAATTVERWLTAPQGALVQLTVAVNADGTLTLRYPFDMRPATIWAPVEPLVFRRTTAPYDLLAFDSDGAGQPAHLFLTYSVPLSFERVAWYETLPAQGTLFGVALLGMLLALVGLPLASRRASARWWAVWAGALLGLVVLGAATAAMLTFDDTQPLSPWIGAAMLGAWPFAALTVLGLVQTVRSLGRREQHWTTRFLALAGGLGSGLLALLLIYWKVLALPFHRG